MTDYIGLFELISMFIDSEYVNRDDNSIHNSFYELSEESIINSHTCKKDYATKLENVISIMECSACHYKYGKIMTKSQMELLGKNLKKLNELIGLKEIKEIVVQYIVVYLTDPEKYKSSFKNILILGKSGSGKTVISELICTIFATMTNGTSFSTSIEHLLDYKYAPNGVTVVEDLQVLGDEFYNDSVSRKIINHLSRMMSFTEYLFICTVDMNYFEHTLSNDFQNITKKFKYIVVLEDYDKNELFDFYCKKIETNSIKMPKNIDDVKNLFYIRIKKICPSIKDINIIAEYTVEIYYSNQFFLEESDNTLNIEDIRQAFSNFEKNFSNKNKSFSITLYI